MKHWSDCAIHNEPAFPAGECDCGGIPDCPHCGRILEYFSGLEHIPEYLYCPNCMDWAYDISDGEKLFRLV